MKKFSLELDSPTSLAENAYQMLRRSILDGHLKPGERIIETQIARDIGVSRGPVREAVQRLLQEGLAESVPRHGPQVVKMSAQQIQELYLVRVSLERLAVRQAVERNPDNAADVLEESIARMERAARQGSFRKLVDEEFRFHELLCALSGNQFLVRVYGSIQAYVRMALDIDNSGYEDMMTIAIEHKPLVDAIRKGKLEEAEILIEHHIVQSLKRLSVQQPGTALLEA